MIDMVIENQTLRVATGVLNEIMTGGSGAAAARLQIRGNG